MLTGKQKSKLRGMAQTRKAVVMMGKDGITECIIKSLAVMFIPSDNVIILFNFSESILFNIFSISLPNFSPL